VYDGNWYSLCSADSDIPVDVKIFFNFKNTIDELVITIERSTEQDHKILHIFQMKVPVILLAMICTSSALSLSLPINYFDNQFVKCKDMTVEERKMCRSEILKESQYQLQASLYQLQVSRLQLEKALFEHTVRMDAAVFEHTVLKNSSAELRAQSIDRRENVAFENNLRSQLFPGLAVDPNDSKSIIIALVTLASILAFSIFICCRQDVPQPMLIVNTFMLIMFTTLNGLVMIDPSKWTIWVPVGLSMMVLAGVLPIRFINSERTSYCTVITSGAASEEILNNDLLAFIMIVEAIAVFLRIKFSSDQKQLAPTTISTSVMPAYWVVLLVFLFVVICFVASQAFTPPRCGLQTLRVVMVLALIQVVVLFTFNLATGEKQWAS
jgi:hypothetical protein